MSSFIRAFALGVLTCVALACSEQPASENAAADVSQDSTEAVQSAGSPSEAIAASTSTIDGARILSAEAGNWLSTGRTYDEQRHSPLDQINKDTIKDLGLAWYWNTGTKRGLEATPIVVDGVMFTTGTWSVVWAMMHAPVSCCGSSTRKCLVHGAATPAVMWSTAASLHGRERSTWAPLTAA